MSRQVVALHQIAVTPVEGVPNADANAGEGSFLPPVLFGINKDSGELTVVRQPFSYAGGITFVTTK